MARTKEQIKADLNLDGLPDDEFMELLEKANKISQAKLDSSAPPSSLVSDTVTPGEIVQMLSEALREGSDSAKTNEQSKADLSPDRQPSDRLKELLERVGDIDTRKLRIEDAPSGVFVEVKPGGLEADLAKALHAEGHSKKQEGSN